MVLKNFAKCDINNTFLLIFSEFFEKFIKKLRKFLKNVRPVFCVFRLNAQKFHAWFKRLEKYAQIIIFCNLRKTFLANFPKFSGVRGLRPRTPYEADPLKMAPPPRTEILQAPQIAIFFLVPITNIFNELLMQFI